MGVEYYFVDIQRSEYAELGKIPEAKELLDIMKKAKKASKLYHKVYQKIRKEFDYFDDIDEDYELFLKEKFFKDLYDWITDETICYNDASYLYFDGYVGYRENEKPFDFLKSFNCIATRFPTDDELAEVVKEYEKKENPITKAIENLESIKGKCLTIQLDKLNHVDRTKLYDIIFDDGLVDKTIKILKELSDNI